MDNLALDLFELAEANSGTLRKLCKPLDRYFGSTALCLVYTTKKNKMLNIHTDMRWMERCIEEKYFLDDPLMTGVEDQVPGFQLLEERGTDGYKNGLLKEAVDIYDMCHGVSYTKKYECGTLSVCMTTSNGNKMLRERALSETESIILFLNYLMNELIRNFDKTPEKMIDLSELRSMHLYKQQPKEKQVCRKLSIEDKINFFSAIGKISPEINLKISRQEKRCIQGIVQGNTVPETAAVMGLSVKTVENYLRNAKQKLAFRYNREFVGNRELLKSLDIVY